MAATEKAPWGPWGSATRHLPGGTQHLIGVWGHPDQIEGPPAVVEKREPEWEPLA